MPSYSANWADLMRLLKSKRSDLSPSMGFVLWGRVSTFDIFLQEPLLYYSLNTYLNPYSNKLMNLICFEIMRNVKC